MQTKRNVRNFIVALFFLIVLINTMTNRLDYQKNFQATLALWVKYIIPSLVPLYIISNILYAYPFISLLTYPILKPILHFENQKSCSLFFLSLITGQPTITFLIHKAYTNTQISLTEANRLMRFTSHLSPLFILAITLNSPLPTYSGYLLICSQYLASMIIACFSKNQHPLKQANHFTTDISFSTIIEDCPLILLRILMIMIIVSLIRFPFLPIINSIEHSIIKYPFDLLEITIGLSSIIYYQLPSLILLPLISFTISLSGLCIILQTIYAIKKTSFKLASYLSYRLFHGLIALILCLLFELLL